eukprot:Selendium_serpulae@DN6119_c1_g1_i7.p1
MAPLSFSTPRKRESHSDQLPLFTSPSSSLSSEQLAGQDSSSYEAEEIMTDILVVAEPGFEKEHFPDYCHELTPSDGVEQIADELDIDNRIAVLPRRSRCFFVRTYLPVPLPPKTGPFDVVSCYLKALSVPGEPFVSSVLRFYDDVVKLHATENLSLVLPRMQYYYMPGDVCSNKNSNGEHRTNDIVVSDFTPADKKSTSVNNQAVSQLVDKLGYKWYFEDLGSLGLSWHGQPYFVSEASRRTIAMVDRVKQYLASKQLVLHVAYVQLAMAIALREFASSEGGCNLVPAFGTLDVRIDDKATPLSMRGGPNSMRITVFPVPANDNTTEMVTIEHFGLSVMKQTYARLKVPRNQTVDDPFSRDAPQAILDVMAPWYICPRTHPYAYSRGEQCCPVRHTCDGRALTKLSTCCEEDAIPCLSSNCSDNRLGPLPLLERGAAMVEANRCPRDFPYPYHKGSRCCAVEFTANHEILRLDSYLCLQRTSFNETSFKCPQPPCVPYLSFDVRSII